MIPSKTRLLLVLSFLLFLPTLLNAQNISVKSFRLLETDLTANLEGTKEIDQNGEVAALIKVITTETGFVFDVGMLGIVRQVQKVGEIWVYVPHGIQRISVNHQKLGRLAEPYYFSIPIQQARTYELELTTNRVKTIIEEDAGGGFLSLHVTPSSAIVFIDNQLQTLRNGSLSTFLLYGSHTYRIEAPGYKAETGTISIVSEDTQTLDVTLQSSQATVTFVTEMDDAEIWVNNERKGQGRWMGNLGAGTYIVETRKAGCRPQRTTVTFKEQEVRTVTLDAPIPIVGKLRTESDPSGADVLLGGKSLGQTPSILKDIPVGTQLIVFRKKGYEDRVEEVTVNEGQITAVSVELTPLPKTKAEIAKEQAALKAEEKAKAKELAKAEAEEKAKVRAEEKAKAKAEAEEKAKVKAENRAKAKEEAKAKAEEKAKAKAMAKAEAKEKSKAKAEEKAQAKAENKAIADEKSKAKAEEKSQAKEQAKTKAAEKPKKESSPSAPADSRSVFNKDFNFYADAHFLLGSPSAAGVALGAYVKGIHAEVAYDYSLASPVPLYWTFIGDSGLASDPVRQEYKPTSFVSGSLGYGIVLDRLRLTPRVGAGLLTIVADTPSHPAARYQQTYVVSGAASLRAEYALMPWLSVNLTPAYSFPIQRGVLAERLADYSPAIARWNNGLSLRIGISYNF